RHTRFSRDWSSDVCSSDLARRRALVEKLIGNAGALQPFELKQIKKDHGLDLEHFHVGIIISDLNTKLSSDLGELQRNLQDAIIEIGRASCRERVKIEVGA